MGKRKHSGDKRVAILYDNSVEPPYCIHGPTILFSSSIETYYSCSSCRNNECPIKIGKVDWEDKKIKEKNAKYRKLSLDSDDKGKICNIFSETLSANKNTTCTYCLECHKPVIGNKECNINSKHMTKSLTLDKIKHPSSWLPPLSNDSVEAQYFFTAEVLDILINVIKKNGIRKTICIGAPTVHDRLRNAHSNIKTILLDIDKRFCYFNRADEFLHYNMFNHHFFGGDKDKQIYEKYLECQSNEKMAVIMDPPFGGRIEPLVHTLKQISDDYQRINGSVLEKEILPTLWVFPYFAEPHICNMLPEFQMHDYQIEYKNHKQFKAKSTNKSNPVRIFTNLPLNTIDLSHNSAYRYCKECSKYVIKSNVHCNLCMKCPSKDGSSYKHCMKCKKCVKPSYVHCDICMRCCLEVHQCGALLPELICYNCQQKGHKRIDCPKLTKKHKK